MTSLMHHDMLQQPDVLSRFTARFDAQVAEIATLVRQPPSSVVFVARGSSDNAAGLGRYAVELATGRPVALAAPSLTTRYQAPHDCRGLLAVGLSQSGRTPEIDTSLRAMRAAGARTIAITNDVTSPLATGADLVVPLNAGPEQAIPATKTVTAQMLAVLAIAAALGPLPLDQSDLGRLPEQANAILADPDPARRLAARWSTQTTLVVAARGLLLAAAHETALKIRETAAITAVGSSSADLVHGPVAAVGEGAAVLLIDGDPATATDLAELRGRMHALGADTAELSPDGASTLPMLSTQVPLLAPLLATIRGQQLALELALARDLDPDTPAGLTKVTLSR